MSWMSTLLQSLNFAQLIHCLLTYVDLTLEGRYALQVYLVVNPHAEWRRPYHLCPKMQKVQV